MAKKKAAKKKSVKKKATRTTKKRAPVLSDEKSQQPLIPDAIAEKNPKIEKLAREHLREEEAKKEAAGAMKVKHQQIQQVMHDEELERYECHDTPYVIIRAPEDVKLQKMTAKQVAEREARKKPVR